MPTSQAEVDKFNIVTEFPCLLELTVIGMGPDVGNLKQELNQLGKEGIELKEKFEQRIRK